MTFGLEMVRVCEHLKANRRGCPEAPEGCSGIQVLTDMLDDDKMVDWYDFGNAELADVLVYLRGSRSLRMPPEWRLILPRDFDYW